jgi:hypothetical protein
LIYPLVERTPGGLLARGGADMLQLSSPLGLSLAGSVARAALRLEAGQRLAFALQH